MTAAAGRRAGGQTISVPDQCVGPSIITRWGSSSFTSPGFHDVPDTGLIFAVCRIADVVCLDCRRISPRDALQGRLGGPLADLPAYRLTAKARSVIEKGRLLALPPR